MRAVKVVENEDGKFIAHLIDLSKVRCITYTYPAEDKQEENQEVVIGTKPGHEVEFIFDGNDSMEFDLGKTPTIFIVYNDYGDEIINTDELIELEESIIEIMSNENPAFEDEVPGGM